MITTAPPGFVKMASGKIVRASSSLGLPKLKTKKFLLVLQHYNGDVQAAEELASLIADLERTRNHDVDVLLFRRADSRELSDTVRKKLESKFDRVLLQACRRPDAKSYPYGPNQMFCDLIMLMSQVPPFATDYYAFLNMETDAVPTRPGWLGELIAAWKAVHAEGKAAVGHIEDNPHNHLNGLAVYSADLYRRAGGTVLAGGSPQVCFDIRFSPTILPMAKDTPLVYFEYRKPTITAAELFAARKEGIAPALWHGVKDDSARRAVRARHITFTDRANTDWHEEPMVVSTGPLHMPSLGVFHGKPTPGWGDYKEPSAGEKVTPIADADSGEIISGKIADENYRAAQAANVGLKVATAKAKEEMASAVAQDFDLNKAMMPLGGPSKRPSVYCYHQPASKANADEQRAIQSIWQQGWSSRGFNPVVLTLRDAARNPRYDDFQVHIERFPFIGGKREHMNRFNRWLALEMVGSGLMVEVDVLPGNFTPADITRTDVGLVLSPKESGVISAAIFDAPNLVKFIHEIELYDAKPEDVIDGRECVTDFTVWLAHCPDAIEPTVVDSAADKTGAKLVRFGGKGFGRTSQAMQMFLTHNETVVA